MDGAEMNREIAAASTNSRRRPLRTDPLSRQGRNRHRSFRAREGAATIAAYVVALATLVIGTPTAPRRPAALDHAVLIPPVEYVRTPISDRSPEEERASRGVPRETTTTTVAPATTTTTIRARQRPATPATTAPPAAVDEWGLPLLLRRIGGCESGGGPTGPLVWTAHNLHSTASGAFEYLDSTWNRYGGFARAMYAPPSVQVERALSDYSRSGTTPWRASRACWG